MKFRPLPPHIHSGFRSISWEQSKFLSLLPFWLATVLSRPTAALKIFPLLILTVYFLQWMENRLTARSGRFDQYVQSGFCAILLGLFLPEAAGWAEIIAAAVFFRMLIGIYGGHGFHLFHPVLGAYVLLHLCFSWDRNTPFWISGGGASWLQAGGAVTGFLIYLAVCRRYREMPWLFGTVYVFSSVLWGIPLQNLNEGVSVLCFFAVFILGDLATTPTTRVGYRFFAICAGLLSPALERWGGGTQIFSLAAAFMLLNASVAWIDEWFRPKPVTFRDVPA